MANGIDKETLWQKYVRPALDGEELPADARDVLSSVEAGFLRGRCDNPNRVLFDAARHGSKERLFAALICGAKVNSYDVTESTPLHKAAYFGHTDVAELLLENGANLNAKK